MIYHGMYETEYIVFHTNGDVDDICIISLTKNLDGKTSRVEVDFDEEWHWDFEMYPGAYEMIKYMIMDVSFNCDNEDELLMELDAMFEESFRELVVNDEDCNCGHDCKHCSCKE